MPTGGKSGPQPYGMVGFIKELVDEQGAADLTRANWTGRVSRGSGFDYHACYRVY